MKKTTKIFALFLVALMLLPSILACSKKDGDASDSNTSAVSTSSDDSNSLYDEKGYLKDSLPDLDYEGAPVRMLGWDGYIGDFYVDTDTGDTILDSVYYRNIKVEERLKVDLTAEIIPGGNNSMDEFVSTVVNTSLSGVDAYDIVGAYSMVAGSLAMQGVVCNMYDLEHIDFEKPWWSKNLIEASTINDAIYFASGDLSNGYLYSMQAMALNRSLLTQLKLDDPRQLVIAGKWTLEELYKLTTNVGVELDSVGGKTAGDQYGLVCTTDVYSEAFVIGSGIKLSAENSSGVLQLTDDYTGNKMHTLLLDLTTQFNGNDWLMEGASTAALKGGNSLFGVIEMSMCGTLAQGSWAFSPLPLPKYNTDQTDYYTNIGFTYTAFCIPNAAKDTDMSAAVLECMNSEAYRSSAVTLFETMMKGRFSQDPMDIKMYDIIRSSVYVDMARVFSNSFSDWSRNPTGAIRRYFQADTAGDWMSTMAGIKGGINETLKQIDNAIIG